MANVPNVPGVPALAEYAADFVVLAAQDFLTALLGGAPNVWGIFLDGAQVFDYESFATFEFSKDFLIADYPVEPGSFQSYDKVEEPAEIRVTLTSGGDEASRNALLQDVLAAVGTTDLYDVVTPNGVFVGFNIRHADYKQTANSGLGMLIIRLTLQQIRVSASATFQNTQQPGDAGRVGNGNVQPTSVPTDVQQNFDASGGAT